MELRKLQKSKKFATRSENIYIPKILCFDALCTVSKAILLKTSHCWISSLMVTQFDNLCQTWTLLKTSLRYILIMRCQHLTIGVFSHHQKYEIILIHLIQPRLTSVFVNTWVKGNQDNLINLHFKNRIQEDSTKVYSSLFLQSMFDCQNRNQDRPSHFDISLLTRTHLKTDANQPAFTRLCLINGQSPLGT